MALYGKEELEFIYKEYPDLIITDLMMPEMDGITITKTIKNNFSLLFCFGGGFENLADV